MFGHQRDAGFGVALFKRVEQRVVRGNCMYGVIGQLVGTRLIRATSL